MLTFDEKKRITVDEAIQHEYLKDLHDPEDEPKGNELCSLDFEFEKYDLTLAQYKDLLYEEILMYHFPEFVKD